MVEVSKFEKIYTLPPIVDYQKQREEFRKKRELVKQREREARPGRIRYVKIQRESEVLRKLAIAKAKQSCPPVPKKHKKAKHPKAGIDRRHAKPTLGRFWEMFGGHKEPEYKIGMEGRLDLLKRYAEVVINKPSKKKIVIQREQMNRQRTFKLYLMFHRKCWVCLDRSDHRHHIIQLQNGGDTSKLNLIPVCRPCHEKVHPWLKG